MNPEDLPNATKRLLVERMADYILDHDYDEMGRSVARMLAYSRLFQGSFVDLDNWILANYEEAGNGKEKT